MFSKLSWNKNLYLAWIQGEHGPSALQIYMNPKFIPKRNDAIYCYYNNTITLSWLLHEDLAYWVFLLHYYRPKLRLFCSYW